MLQWAGVERVLNLVEDEEYRPEEREAVERALAEAGIQEHRLPFADFGGLPVEPLDQAVAIVSSWLGEGRRIYIHCRAGWQRAGGRGRVGGAAQRGRYRRGARDGASAKALGGSPAPSTRGSVAVVAGAGRRG